MSRLILLRSQNSHLRYGLRMCTCARPRTCAANFGIIEPPLKATAAHLHPHPLKKKKTDQIMITSNK